MNKLVKRILIGLLVVLVIIQFIRPDRNDGPADTPNDISHVVNYPQNVKMILEKACYDCHSNHTNYPWYYNINPVGLWMNKHIVDGKRHLNFSEATKYDIGRFDHKMGDIPEVLEKDEMPLSSYTLIHRDAILSKEEIATVTEWVKTERAKLDVPPRPERQGPPPQRD